MTYYYDDEARRQIDDAKCLLDTIIISDGGDDHGVIMLGEGNPDSALPTLNAELLKLAEILNATTSPRPEVK